MLLPVVIGIGVPVLALIIFWRRSVTFDQRELAGRCAYCPTRTAVVDGFRVEGRLVCSTCAHRLRRRVMTGFKVLGLLALFGLTAGLLLAVRDFSRGASDWWFGLVFGAGSVIAFGGLGVVVWYQMRFENRSADKIAGIQTLIHFLGSFKKDSSSDDNTSERPDA